MEDTLSTPRYADADYNHDYDSLRADTEGSQGAAGVDVRSLLHQLIVAAQNERLCCDVLKYPGTLIDQASSRLVQQRELADALEQRHLERLRRRTEGLPPLDDDRTVGGDGLLNLYGGDPNDATAQHGKEVSLHDLSLADADLSLPFQAYNIMRIEATRIEFLLTELIRVRMQKLQALAHRVRYYMEERYKSLLSPAEKVLVEQLCELLEKAISNSALQPMVISQNSTVFPPPPAPLGEAPAWLPFQLARRFFMPHMAGSLAPPQHRSPSISPAQPIITLPARDPLPKPLRRHRVFVLVLSELGHVEIMPGAEQDLHEGDIIIAPLAVLERYLYSGRVRLL